MSGEPELTPQTQDPPPPPQDAAPPVLPPKDDEPDVLEIPTGEKLVPLSALETAREKAKTLRTELESVKAEAGKSAEKDAKIQQLEQQLQQFAPIVQAYNAAVEAQQRAPKEPQGPTPEEKAELEEIAKDFDFYKADGTLDLDRAARVRARETKRAEQIASERVAPFEQQTTAQQSNFMLERALITKAPDGSQPDPEVLKLVWSRLDRRLTATPEGAAQAYSVALGHSAVLGKLKGKSAPQEQIPDPLHTERAGGKETPGEVTLTESDRRAARDMGLTDKQYMETLKEMPAGWGKGA